LWRVLTGKVAQFDGNEATAWGQEHEADAIHAYEQTSGSIVRPAAFVPYESWSGCSPDGWVLDGSGKGIVECKAPYSQRVHESIPDYYLAQIIGQLGITGADWCDFVSWTPDETRIIRVDAQPETWNRMEKELRAFWFDCVLADKEPKRASKFQLKGK
jgi:putative phage-type endonuclease